MGRNYEQISAEDFAAADGVADWRVVDDHAFASYRTGDFVTALALVTEIGRLAEEANHHPDLMLGYGRVEARLTTHDANALTTADLDLCRAISVAAGELDVTAEPDAIGPWRR